MFGTNEIKAQTKVQGWGSRACAVVLAGMLASTLVVMPKSALAAAGETGKVTINAVDGNRVTYLARQVFSADLDESGTARDIGWASTGVKNAVVAAINAWAQDAEVDGVGENPTEREVVEYLNANWGASSTTRVAGHDDLPNVLADALDGLGNGVQVTPGQEAELAEGWWLVVATSDSIEAGTTTGNVGRGEAGTSPIFVQANKDVPVVVTEKTTIPTVRKEVRDDASGAEFGLVADASKDQPVEFKLTGTVASNVATYDTYYYAFEDTLTNLDLTDAELAAVRVSVDGTDVTNGLKAQDGSSITRAGGKLSVVISDLKELATVTASTNVVVEYRARLTGTATMGSTANNNVVRLSYSKNPNTEAHGTTSESQVRTYTYALELTKKDNEDATLLPGAKFSVRDDASSKYVQADGSLGDVAYEFETDENGVFSVERIDAGTYTIHETQAPVLAGDDPVHYAAWDHDLSVSIIPTYDADGVLSQLRAEVHGGLGDEATTVKATAMDTGRVSVDATDIKRLAMPLTGREGMMLLTVAGVTIVAVSLYALRREE